MIFKIILGIHGKASNLAINAELGTFPACFISFILMFKYYNRHLSNWDILDFHE
jgi:hypothetical protein